MAAHFGGFAFALETLEFVLAAAFQVAAPAVLKPGIQGDEGSEPALHSSEREGRHQIERDDQRSDEHDGGASYVQRVLQRIGQEEAGSSAGQDGVLKKAQTSEQGGNSAGRGDQGGAADQFDDGRGCCFRAHPFPTEREDQERDQERAEAERLEQQV